MFHNIFLRKNSISLILHYLAKSDHIDIVVAEMGRSTAAADWFGGHSARCRPNYPNKPPSTRFAALVDHLAGFGCLNFFIENSKHDKTLFCVILQDKSELD